MNRPETNEQKYTLKMKICPLVEVLLFEKIKVFHFRKMILSFVKHNGCAIESVLMDKTLQLFDNFDNQVSQSFSMIQMQ